MTTTPEQFAEEIAPFAHIHIRLELPFMDAFLLLGVLQLVLRHPDLPDSTRTMSLALAKTLERSLALTPILKEATEMGWDPQFDIPPH